MPGGMSWLNWFRIADTQVRDDYELGGETMTVIEEDSRLDPIEAVTQARIRLAKKKAKNTVLKTPESGSD